MRLVGSQEDYIIRVEVFFCCLVCDPSFARRVAFGDLSLWCFFLVIRLGFILLSPRTRGLTTLSQSLSQYVSEASGCYSLLQEKP